MGLVQTLIKERVYRDASKKEVHLPPFIDCKYKSTPFCRPPKCMACEFSKAKLRNPKLAESKLIPGKQHKLSEDQYKPGDYVSSDQFVVKTPGWLTVGYGREGAENCFHGGTMYVDAASGLLHVEPQILLGAGETLIRKARFEQRVYDLADVRVKHYHSDNGIYTSEMF